MNKVYYVYNVVQETRALSIKTKELIKKLTNQKSMDFEAIYFLTAHKKEFTRNLLYYFLKIFLVV